MNFIKLKLLLLPVSVLFTGICFCQDNLLSEAEFHLTKKNKDSVLYFLNKVELENSTQFEKGKYFEIKGILEIQKDNHDLAFKLLKDSKKKYLSIDSLHHNANINLHIIDLLAHQENTIIDSKPYIDEYIDYSQSSNSIIDKANAFATLAVTYLNKDQAQLSIDYFNKAIKAAYIGNDTILATDYLFNKAVVYNTIGKKYDSAISIFQRVIPIYKNNNDLTYVAYGYNNLAESYKKLGKYSNAISYYQKADSIKLEKNEPKSKIIFYQNMINLYEEKGDFTSAYFYLKKIDSINELLNNKNQDLNILDIEEKYDNEKLRVEILKVQSKRKETTNLLIGALLLLLFVGVISYLINKNTKRKQRIAEQEREIEIQKTEKILKEQEITTINAMVAGQEKERQRLASDLHDSVGATLAAARLQFEHLAKNKEKTNELEDLFTKTSKLLNTAYTEVRSMAHTKNSGVMAKDGLLPAVHKLAKTVSVKGGLQIEVTDFGLDDRLENALEITIFRIIQELVTNIVKHANATLATVSISKFEDGINIMVEDNGKGFVMKNKQHDEGMGLGSIERRVEFLEGSLDVDTTLNKGTTIVIDIPI